MSLEMILNELSHKHPAENIHVARSWLSNLCETILAGSNIGIKKVLRTDGSFFQIQLAPGYFLPNWLNDRQVDEVERLFFRTIITKTPFLRDLEPLEVTERVEFSECFFDGEKANGFLYAYLLNALSVSLLSHPKWDIPKIENVIIHQLNESSGDLEENPESLRHASRAEHLASHQTWIIEQIQDSIRDGNDIWHRKDELYRSLIFCDSIRRQLKKINSSHPVFPQVKQRLDELESYCRNWTTGAFTPNALSTKARPESEATLQQFGKERRFECPDGVEREFSWHVNLNPGAWRLYFYPLEHERRIIVGYIGPHLQIVSEN